MSRISIQLFLKALAPIFLSFFCLSSLSAQEGFYGYYRYPDVHGSTIVFSAEGDLWTVPLSGGLARRLTTHQEEETHPSFSPDGKTIAFTASYEGPRELYTMPATGGIPTRWTYEREFAIPNDWMPDGKIAFSTLAYSRRPDEQVVVLDTETKEKTRIPLYQASEASFDDSGNTIYFVRPAYHRNVTKRYQGGTARQIWKYVMGSDEAVKLTTDHPGESHHPMYFDSRVYFITDRDGTMNIWSMNDSGGDLKQHTTHADFDVRYANLSEGNIVYHRGADLWHLDLDSGQDKKLDIRLATDLDQLREKWDDNPAKYITSAHTDPDGERIVITARGRVFVAPVKSGRFISFTDKKDVRYRDAVFSNDGKNIYTLSDETGEFEFVRIPADGVGDSKTLSNDGKILRYKGEPSPDGKWIAYDDLGNNMYVLNISTGVSKKISSNRQGIRDFSWSPDSRWLAFVQEAKNTMTQIIVYNVGDGSSFELTTDRANSFNPRWSPDGKFIYFLSDRSFTSLVGNPWGSRQPEPYFDASEKLYHVALKRGGRSPFREPDELYKMKDEDDQEESDKKVVVSIDKTDIARRIAEVPIPAGNYSSLEVNKDALYLMSKETGLKADSHLSFVKINNEDVELGTLVADADRFELAANGEKILIRKGKKYYMVESGTDEITDLSEHEIDLSNWKFPLSPREDWKQIFTDAWRMERDYFYDENMHGVDWTAMYEKYLPMVDRVATRSELSDLIGRFVGELSALHTSVRGGDHRLDDNDIDVASLGAEFSRDEAKNGFRIDYIYQGDPDYPDVKSPLDDPYLDVRVGDIVTHVDGRKSLTATDMGQLIRNKVGKQVRLKLLRGTVSKEIIVKPIKNEYDLRYRDWEYGNRLIVEEKGNDQIGYVHLRAMGSGDLNQFYREFYPVFNKQGLIIDMRYNRGGNIDSFILEKLMRKAWMYWKARSGDTYWNMQYAFRGHIVVLVNENTYSDGEAFADGFKKLGLGTTLGVRTWGGEIWLNSNNRLSDNGLARAPMIGVYSEKGDWIIEGHGFVPDIEVDNLPHETFNGKDRQLDTAIELLQKKIKEDPREVPPVPAYPDKSFGNNKKQD